MSLKSVPCVCGFLDSLVQGHIDGVPFLPHLIGTGVKHALDLVPHFSRGSSLALGPLDVVIAEFSPGLGNGNARNTIMALIIQSTKRIKLSILG